MCPFEQFLGFCPFAVLRGWWRKLTGASMQHEWAPVELGPFSGKSR